MSRMSTQHLVAARRGFAAQVAENIRVQAAIRGLNQSDVGQRRAGFSWADIGRGLGVTRQAAQMTWGRAVEELEHAETRAMSRELVG